jgi:hypothetical protein
MGDPINVTTNSTGNIPAISATSSATNGSPDAVYGLSNTGIGVHGQNGQGADPDGPGGPGSSGPTFGQGCGVYGESLFYQGVWGASGNQHGVYGTNGKGSGSNPGVGCGVWGDSTAGYGVFATSQTNKGLFATSKGDDGIHGETGSSTHYGVSAANNNAWPCCAIYGTSANGHGVHGLNQGSAGPTPNSGCGVWGESQQGIGVYGASKSGNAGEFHGNVSITGNQSVSGNVTVGGNVNVTGDVVLTVPGSDCGERFDVSGLEAAEAGTVMVIGEDGLLQPSDRAYDKRVAGVVSGAGTFRPAIVMGKRDDDEGRTTLALIGKVYCKVDANAGAIGVGDLLTTSDTPGHAMGVADPVKAFGSVIGKSLGTLRSGLGLIPILIALQ